MSAEPDGPPPTAGRLRVGFFGILGSGNIGNDGSLQVVLAYLRQHHPDAQLDAMCTGAEQVRRQFGIATTSLHRSRGKHPIQSPAASVLVKSLRLASEISVDAALLTAWVRRHDAVIVPGMGVLEATLPLRPWQMPFSLAVLTASGRLFGTKVMLVSVGANVMKQRWTRWLVSISGRMATYRSYRDDASRVAAERMGIDVAHDPVYPDLAFQLDTPRPSADCTGIVGVGVMDYRGGNDDRREAEQVRAVYVSKIKTFVRWLVDNGYEVRLFTGDTADEAVVQEVLSDVRIHRPELLAADVVPVHADSLDDLMHEMASVEAVVATRFHNVLCSLKVATPTISIGYAPKQTLLMTQMGLPEFCQDVQELDVGLLVRQFENLRTRRDEIVPMLRARSAESALDVGDQLAEISSLLAPANRRSANRQPHERGRQWCQERATHASPLNR